MMAMLKPWWRDRSRREQWLLGVMAALLVVTIVWLGVLGPLTSARDAAAARHDTAVRALGDVEAMTVQIRRAERTASPTISVPLVELVGQRAREAGLTTQRIDSSGDGRVTMRVDVVRPAPLLRWLGDLKTRDGITTESLMAVRNDDSTIAADIALRSGSGR